jgi:hypothetical protein
MIREDILRWAAAAGLAFGSGLVGWLLRRLVAGRLARLLRSTRADWDDALLAAVAPHVPLWFLIVGGILGLRYAHPDPVLVTRVDRFALAIFMFSVTLALAA